MGGKTANSPYEYDHIENVKFTFKSALKGFWRSLLLYIYCLVSVGLQVHLGLHNKAAIKHVGIEIDADYFWFEGNCLALPSWQKLDQWENNISRLGALFL